MTAQDSPYIPGHYAMVINGKRLQEEGQMFAVPLPSISPEHLSTGEHLQRKLHLVEHQIPRTEPLAEVASRPAPDVQRLQGHELATLIGATALALVWYGMLWLVG